MGVRLSNKWETWFRALKEFKEEHSHCDVPRKLVGGLGFWVMRQRSEKRCGRMKVDRVQRLEELGFQWDTPKTLDMSFCRRQLSESESDASPVRLCHAPVPIPLHGLYPLCTVFSLKPHGTTCDQP